MSMLDVFNDSAFDTVSMTTAVDKLPIIPGRIGEMGLFKTKPITTLTAVIDERDGKLSILPTGSRGTAGSTGSRPSRRARSFLVPHIPHDDVVLADEVQGVRAFGKETQLETVAGLVNEKLALMKQNHEATWEYHRIGAIHGVVKDEDGSTIFDWFSEFGLSETVVSFALNVATTNIKGKATSVIRSIRSALGNSPFKRIHAICGNDFFDDFVNHAEVKGAFERYQSNQFARNQQIGKGGFEFAGITWENYDITMGATKYVADDDCRFFPTGTNGVFERINAPADFIEAVNTKGRPIYVKKERMKYDKGVELHSQSNPLFICTRPKILVKGTKA